MWQSVFAEILIFVVDCFRRKAPLQLFDKVLSTHKRVNTNNNHSYALQKFPRKPLRLSKGLHEIGVSGFDKDSPGTFS